jgi:radical SAM protein with 4Fe4S-binding SPASM domain
VSETSIMDTLIRWTTENHLPITVHVDLTYRCNERCVHCYLDHDDHGEMTTKEICTLFEELAEIGTLFLTISGGEIFLRKDFFELLEYARLLHFDVSLKTNALLVDAERSVRLRELGVRRVQVSLYSADPSVHDRVTCVPGSFARTLAGVQRLKAAGLLVKLACPLMNHNLAGYRAVMALAAELELPYVMDLTITPMMDGGMRTVAFRSTVEDLGEVLSDPDLNPVLADKNYAPGHKLTGSATSSGLESPPYADIPCSAGHNSCYVSPYGDVYPCVQLPLPAGNIRRQRFAEIWYGAPEMQRVRRIRESELNVCPSCSLRSYCERCPGLALMEGGDLLGPYERACELAEAKARAAGVENPMSAFHTLASKPTAAFPPQPIRVSTQSLVQIAPLPRTVRIFFEGGQ